jgi:hypothetical protein
MSEAELGIGPGGSKTASEGPSPASTVGAVDRRRFLTLSGTSALALSGVTRSGRHSVDPALVGYFRHQLTGHYAADMLLGSGDLITSVVAEGHLIGRLLDDAEPGVRGPLAEVGSAYAAFVGWLYLDTGDPEAALHWHGTALELAHRSGNPEAVACSLVDRAMAHTDCGAGVAVVDLCTNALSDGRRLSPEVRVFALQQQAHGASLLGDRREVDVLLDEAARLIGQVDVEQWGTACLRTPAYVEVQRATCYGRLGDAADADRLWTQIIPASPPISRRDVGVWSARHARVKASMGDPEHALDLARTAAVITMETRSARGANELLGLARDMRTWHDAPVGQALADVLTPISQGGVNG